MTQKIEWFPIGIGIGLTIVVLWNMVFIAVAISTAPEVNPAYTHALER